MLCPDKNDHDGKPIEYKLYGPDSQSKNRHIEIIYKPCNPADNHVSRGCLSQMKDKSLDEQLQAQIDYIGHPELLIIANSE